MNRAADVALAGSALVLASPVLALAALAIKLEDGGPVLYRQTRVGRGGEDFELLKLRTMVADAEPDGHARRAQANDPRMTRVGRALRKMRLDEMPQLINILKGDMSAVGPRPERPFFIERFRREVPEYMARHYVKSGITGWAQVHGWRGDTSIEDRVAHDLYYIRNWALALDFKILLLTLTKTFFHRNAY